MAHERHQAHDHLVHKVYSDAVEAADLLRPQLPEWLSATLEWPTLTLRDGSYVTQDEETVEKFGAELQRQVPGPGGDMKTYAEVLLQRGRQEGRQEGQLGTIEGFLRAGVGWPIIKVATGIDEETFQALRQQREESDRTIG